MTVSPISLGTVDLQEEDLARAIACLKAGQLSPGPTTLEFEHLVAERHHLAYATFCNSGQSALHLILEALKLQGPLRTVGVPALTYISSLHAVWNAGLQVRLVDVDPQTYLMDMTHLPSCDVLMPVHLFGLPLPRPSSPLAVPYIVEDACECLGGDAVGWGDAAAFSFYVAHTITTGVGGMVATPHPWLDDAVKRLCNHGRWRAQDLYAGTRTHVVDPSVRFLFTETGFSYKLGDVNAALGIGQMGRLSSIIQARQQVAARLTKVLQPYPLQLPTGEGHTYMMYPLVCREAKVRDRLMAHLAEAGIESRHLMPITNQPVVLHRLGRVEGEFPVARYLNAHGFYLGCHQRMTEADVTRIAEAFRAFFGTA